MSTPMESNLKLLSVASSESFDATMYCQMIGSLMYPIPDICFVVNTFETCSPDGSKACRGTIDYGIKYDANQKFNLEGYVDSYWVGSSIDRKSTSGCCFSMGLGVISWFTRKYSCVSLSTAKAEYVTACSASCEEVWLRKLLFDLFDLQLDATCIHCESSVP